MLYRSLLASLRKLDAGIASVEGWALILILAVMMLVAFAQVILRNFFSTALTWGDGLTRALVLWAGFIGASLAVKSGKYISMDAASRILNDKQKRIARYFIYAFSVIACLGLGSAGVGFVQMEKAAGTTYSIGVASWIIELVIPITFFFLSLRFLLKLVSLIEGDPMEKQEWE
jgi:TRAP-type C4-dicarboxylate transport system permease small subunit